MEEDYRLFQLVKRNPINNCVDLSKNMIGRRNGVFYFTQHFRIDFENKMHEIGRLKEENENLLLRLKQLEQENEAFYNGKMFTDDQVKVIKEQTIPKSKVKEKMKEIKSKGICKNTDFCNNSCFYYSTCNVLQDLLERSGEDV